MKKHADSEKIRQEIVAAYNKHLQDMYLDRRVFGRLCAQAETDFQEPGNDSLNRELVFIIDGMDQSKFKVPRLTEMNKALDGHWRPSLHFHGILAPGLFEWYGIMEPDHKKDSNTQAT
eukprot:9105593-Alexandrium_andersonii.AAC.1